MNFGVKSIKRGEKKFLLMSNFSPLRSDSVDCQISLKKYTKNIKRIVLVPLMSNFSFFLLHHVKSFNTFMCTKTEYDKPQQLFIRALFSPFSHPSYLFSVLLTCKSVYSQNCSHFIFFSAWLFVNRLWHCIVFQKHNDNLFR